MHLLMLGIGLGLFGIAAALVWMDGHVVLFWRGNKVDYHGRLMPPAFALAFVGFWFIIWFAPMFYLMSLAEVP